MSKLVKLKLASKKSLACFRPTRMATPGGATLFPAPEPEAPDDDDGVKSAGVKSAEKKKRTAPGTSPRENLERAMVAVESTEPSSKSKETPKPTEEVLELKTPGFVRVFGCDECEESENDDPSNASSDDSRGDASSPRASAAHPPRHLIPVVHLRVPMKSKDDVRKVVAALQLRGVVDVACDVENQIVKVTGNVDPDRLLKKVKKVKRKSKLISYTNPVEMPVPPEPSSFRPDMPRPPPPPYGPFHQPAFRPPSSRDPHAFTRDPFGPPPVHVRPNVRSDVRPMHYDSAAFFHHCNPPPNVRSPPTASGFYRDVPFHLRPPSSPPHYSTSSFYHERIPPNLRRSTSPPRRRSYYYDRTAPRFRPPPPPPMHFPGGPPSHPRRTPYGPGVPYDFQQVPDRMMHM